MNANSRDSISNENKTNNSKHKYTPKQWAEYLNNLENEKSIGYEDGLRKYMRGFYDTNRDLLNEWLSAYYTTLSDEFFYHTYVRVKKRRIKRLLAKCKVMVITANPIEKAILHFIAVQQKGVKILRFFHGDIVFFVFRWNNYLVAHVHQGETGANTDLGASSTIFNALKLFTPNVIISLGVAFGIDYHTQDIGDVIVSRRLLPYSENKRDEEQLKPNRTQDKTLDRWLKVRLNNAPGFIETVTFGDILTGGSVLSSFSEKAKICLGYTKTDFIVGGEMEGSALYQFSNNENIPGFVLKGICDWGVSKNSIYPNEPEKEEKYKDSLQAFAMSKAVEKCAQLLKDAELFSEPKHADIKKLQKEQKRNSTVLAVVAWLLLFYGGYKLFYAVKLSQGVTLASPWYMIWIEAIGFLLISVTIICGLLIYRISQENNRRSRYNLEQVMEKDDQLQIREARDLGNGYFEINESNDTKRELE